jgi:hypothetical protein
MAATDADMGISVSVLAIAAATDDEQIAYAYGIGLIGPVFLRSACRVGLRHAGKSKDQPCR